MSSLNGIPYINRPSLSGLTSIKADSFTLGNVSISANSISGIDNINFSSFSVSDSAIFNCPAFIYGNLIVSQNIINPNLSNANVEIFNQLSNISNANVEIFNQLSNISNANVNIFNQLSNLQNANVNSNIAITALQNANVNSNIRITTLENKTANITNSGTITLVNNRLQSLQEFICSSNITQTGTFLETKVLLSKTGNLHANSSVYMTGNLFSNSLGNLDAFNAIQALQNANLNIQAGNLSAHNRITTLESKTQLLSSNALVSVFSGNLAVQSNISLEKNINNMANIYSTSTPILNFIGDGGTGNEYYGTLQFCSGDGASRATISSSLVSGNLSLSYGMSLSGFRVRQSGTDLLTVNTANTWVRGNLNVNANLTTLGNQHFLTGNTTIQGNLIVGNVNAISTQSFFLGNVGIGTTNAFGRLQVVGLSNVIGDQLVTGSVGIGTTNTSANVHVENQKIFKDSNKNVLLNPSQAHIYCNNSNNTNTEAHSILCLRTSAGGGCPAISFDRNGIFGWSLYQENSDSSLCIKSGWDMPTSSTFLCMKIDTSRRFFIYGEPSIRCRFHAIGSYAGSYTAGQNINFSYTVHDIAGTSSNNSGVLTLASGYSGFYIISCSGRFSDGNSTNGLYLYGNNQSLFGSSDNVYWGTTDPSNRRCFSYTTTRFLGSSNTIRAQMYAGTTFDIVLISVLYIGIQN